jgi:predicted acyltransferase
VASIDVFRAIIMTIMIFVNDLPWSKNFPHWLEHALPGEDMLGLADIVFPAFLFIVGMSIPFAFENRRAKGDGDGKIFLHILVRSFALITIGVLIANRRLINADMTGFDINVYSLIIMAAFFLIWNIYPKKRIMGEVREEFKVMAYCKDNLMFTIFRWIGILTLVFIVLTFRSAGESVGYIKPSWGILGMIGWSYLFCASAYLISRKYLLIVIGFCLLYYLLTILNTERVIPFTGQVFKVVAGSSVAYAFTISGVAASMILKRYRQNIFYILGGVGLGMILVGLISHNFWIISKIAGTPGWMFLCIGISTLLFLAVYFVVDVHGKEKWFNIIKPAGTATLTCYMLPYIYYSIRNMTGPFLPDPFYDGMLGVIKCIAFTFFIIGFTALLGRLGVKLKL